MQFLDFLTHCLEPIANASDSGDWTSTWHDVNTRLNSSKIVESSPKTCITSILTSLETNSLVSVFSLPSNDPCLSSAKFTQLNNASRILSGGFVPSYVPSGKKRVDVRVGASVESIKKWDGLSNLRVFTPIFFEDDNNIYRKYISLSVSHVVNTAFLKLFIEMGRGTWARCQYLRDTTIRSDWMTRSPEEASDAWLSSMLWLIQFSKPNYMHLELTGAGSEHLKSIPESTFHRSFKMKSNSILRKIESEYSDYSNIFSIYLNDTFKSEEAYHYINTGGESAVINYNGERRSPNFLRIAESVSSSGIAFERMPRPEVHVCSTCDPRVRYASPWQMVSYTNREFSIVNFRTNNVWRWTNNGPANEYNVYNVIDGYPSEFSVTFLKSEFPFDILSDEIKGKIEALNTQRNAYNAIGELLNGRMDRVASLWAKDVDQAVSVCNNAKYIEMENCRLTGGGHDENHGLLLSSNDGFKGVKELRNILHEYVNWGYHFLHNYTSLMTAGDRVIKKPYEVSRASITGNRDQLTKNKIGVGAILSANEGSLTFISNDTHATLMGTLQGEINSDVNGVYIPRWSRSRGNTATAIDNWYVTHSPGLSDNFKSCDLVNGTVLNFPGKRPEELLGHGVLVPVEDDMFIFCPEWFDPGMTYGVELEFSTIDSRTPEIRGVTGSVSRSSMELAKNVWVNKVKNDYNVDLQKLSLFQDVNVVNEDSVSDGNEFLTGTYQGYHGIKALYYALKGLDSLGVKVGVSTLGGSRNDPYGAHINIGNIMPGIRKDFVRHGVDYIRLTEEVYKRLTTPDDRYNYYVMNSFATRNYHTYGLPSEVTRTNRLHFWAQSMCKFKQITDMRGRRFNELDHLRTHGEYPFTLPLESHNLGEMSVAKYHTVAFNKILKNGVFEFRSPLSSTRPGYIFNSLFMTMKMFVDILNITMTGAKLPPCDRLVPPHHGWIGKKDELDIITESVFNTNDPITKDYIYQVHAMSKNLNRGNATGWV